MAYHGRNEVVLVPVDLPLPDAKTLKSKFDELIEWVKAKSPHYCALDLMTIQHTEKGGFAYLNSTLNFQIEFEMQREMQATVEAFGDPQLHELYELWVLTNDRREQEMINRVAAFASHNSFKRGVLLIGAAHRPSLFEKLQCPHSVGAGIVTWDFAWQHEVASLDSEAKPDDDQIGLKSR